MKYLQILLFFLFITLNSFAQYSFPNPYYIDTLNLPIESLCQNKNELNNNSILYKVKTKINWKYNSKLTIGTGFVFFQYQLGSRKYEPNVSSYSTYKYNSHNAYTMGMESELIIPILKNSFSILVQPKYSNFKTNFKTNYSVGTKGSISYNAITLPIGIRYNYYLYSIFRFYLTYLYSPPKGIQFNSKIVFDNGVSNPISLQSGYIFELGAEYFKWTIKLSKLHFYSEKPFKNQIYGTTIYYDFMHFGIKNQLTIGYTFLDKK